MQLSRAQSATQTTRRAPRGGFTLLELIIVLFLMTLLLYMVSPSLSGFAKGRKTADTATQIQSLLNYGRAHAMSEGKNYRLRFDLDKHEYQLQYQVDAEDYEPVPNDFGLLHTLPDEVTLRLDIQPQVETLPQFGESADSNGTGLNMSGVQTPQSDERDGDYVEFRSNGRTDPSVIEILSTTGGAGYALVCQSETEGFQLVAPHADAL